MELLCLHSCYNIAALHSWEIPWFIALPFWFFSMLAHCEYFSTESSGVFPMIFSYFITTLEMSPIFKGLLIIRQEELKTTERFQGLLAYL